MEACESFGFATKEQNLQQQLDDLNALVVGIFRLLLAKQQELYAAVGNMVKVESVLLTPRDFDSKLKECAEHTIEMENLIRQLEPMDRVKNLDAELVKFEVSLSCAPSHVGLSTPNQTCDVDIQRVSSFNSLRIFESMSDYRGLIMLTTALKKVPSAIRGLKHYFVNQSFILH